MVIPPLFLSPYVATAGDNLELPHILVMAEDKLVFPRYTDDSRK
jgi:hypothetical protein